MVINISCGVASGSVLINVKLFLAVIVLIGALRMVMKDETVPHYQLVANHGSPPPRAVQLAREYEGSAKMWSAVAHTQWGNIPGKAAGGTCWFTHGGQQHETDNFSWLVALEAPLVLLMNDGMGPPLTAVKVGNEGGQDMFAAVAVSDEWGSIPGKARDNTCWFPYGGKEESTSVFFWVATMFALKKKGSGDVPEDAVQLAFLHDDDDGLYSAVAHTEWGDIPARATHDACWYAHNGTEHKAESFSFVVTPPIGAALTKNPSGPPDLAMATGFLSDGSGKLYAAVAEDEELGNIPGKARENTCWYSWGGEERTTTNFYWVVCSCDDVSLDKPTHSDAVIADELEPQEEGEGV